MDFRLLNTTESLDLGTTKERFLRNMQAISIAKSDATPSNEELDVLSKYVGWGDSQVFNMFRDALDNEIKNTLTKQEYEALEASIINAHFTDVPVIRTMWKLLEHIGFGKTSNLLILDPSAGNGHFKSASPDWAFNSKWMEIDLDIISGKILQKLHPSSDVRIQGFQDVDIPEQIHFDLAITNVPFGDVNIHAGNIYGTIHNFFLMRMAMLLREGGVLAAITSRYTLDASSDSARCFLDNIGMRLLGAYRLPNTAFKKNARTEVVTDILFFIKDKNNTVGADRSWINTEYVRPPNGYARSYSLTPYYKSRPNRVIGVVTHTGTMYSADSYNVEQNDEFETVSQLEEIGLETLPGNVYWDLAPTEEDFTEVSFTPKVIETAGLFGDVPVSLEKQARVTVLTKLYKLAKELIQADHQDSSVEHTALRKELNDVYDEYVMNYEYINQQRSLELIKGTPAGMFLQALEVVIAIAGASTEYHKATIFFSRTVNSIPCLGANPSIEDAFAFIVTGGGFVSLPKIEKLTGKSTEVVIAELFGKMFYDPSSKQWETRAAYLSGNVRAKLDYARKVCKLAKYDITQNVKELEAVLPVWKNYTDYVTAMQSRWIPNEIIKAFILSLFDMGYYGCEVAYVPALDERRIDFSGYIGDTNLYTTYGTRDMDAKEIISRILNTKPMIVYGRNEDGTSYKDEAATVAVQEKARIIRERFDKWVYDDPQRIVVLEKIFNEKFNSTVNQKFDGSAMTFDGLNNNITLHPYQKDGAARIVYSQNTLISYDVGWGKTFTFLAGIMKSISCGLAKKAMLVVPNHLVEATVKQVMWAFPLANIMFPTEKDKTKSSRPVFCSRIATGNYDIIVVPFSFFKLIPIADEIIRATIQEKINELAEIIEREYGGNNRYGRNRMDTATKKRLEKAKQRLIDKLKKMSEMKKDSSDTITFDKMGIDMLVTDEFHAFKNVEIITRMQSVAGLQTKGNQTTFDMLSKIEWLQKSGCKIVGSTATPITNTVGEAFSLMKYFCPDELTEAGLFTFDAWADMFAVVESAPEMTPDGNGFRMNNRFRKFINVAELSTMIGKFAEMRRGDNEATFSRPEVYGGKMTKIVIPSNEELREYVKSLAVRAEKIKAGLVRPEVDNMLLITSNGRMAALDMSLVVPKKNLSQADMPKISALVNNVYQIWLDSTATKSTQLVFCDVGTWKPTKEEDEKDDAIEEILTLQEERLTKDVYSIVRNLLVAKGIPVEEIMFAHETKTPEQRRKREDDMNSGKIRILIGSTQKMGTGMNVQTRLIAIHHLDAPWRPADIEQRNGRGWRQGNFHKKIAIFVYVIEGSFDGYVWQTLETKMSFIDQLMHGHLNTKEMDDISETVLSFAEIKAAASGNHKIIEFTILSSEKKKLSALKASFDKEKMILIATNKARVINTSDLEKHIERYKAAIALRDETPAEPFMIEIDRMGEYKKITEKADAGNTLIASIKDHIGAVLNGRVSYGLLGFYRGFEIRLNSSAFNKGGTRYSLSHLDMDWDFNVSESPEGTIQSMILASRSFEKAIKNDEEKIEQIKQNEIRFANEVAKPWDLQEKFDAICLRYDELSKELSSSNSNPLDELEKRRETEKAMVAESKLVLSEIAEYIVECHKLPSYLSLFSTIDGTGLASQIANAEVTITDLVGAKIRGIKNAVVEMVEEYEQVFAQVIVKKKNRKTGKVIEAVQFSFI